MRNNDNRKTERKETSSYGNEAPHVTAERRLAHELGRSMSALRADIMILDKIDSINIKRNMDESYADLDIDSALRWEKKLSDYHNHLCDAVDSILAAEVSRGCIHHIHHWQGPAWLRIIRNSKMKEAVRWHETIGRMPLKQQVWALSKIIDYDPNIDYAYDVRAIAYAELGEFDLAIEDFNRAISMSPKNAGFYVNRGIAHSINDEDDLAIQDFDTAISIDPGMDEAYSARGILHVSKEDYRLALFDFSRAIALDPERASYYTNRGNVYDELGQIDLALNDYTKAIHMNPKSVDACTNRGLTFYEVGEFKHAVRDLSKAIKLGRSSADIYRKRADSYKALGKYDKADQDTLWALELEEKCYKG